MEDSTENESAYLPIKRLVLGSLESIQAAVFLESRQRFSIQYVYHGQELQTNIEISDISRLEESSELENCYLRIFLKPRVIQEVAKKLPDGISFCIKAKYPNEESSRFLIEFHSSSLNDPEMVIFRNALKHVESVGEGDETMAENMTMKAKRAEKRKSVDEPYHRNLRSRARLQSTEHMEPEYVKPEVEKQKKPKKKKSNESLPGIFDLYNDIDELFEYRGVGMRMEDFKCLDYRQMLTYNVIDFYLKYIYFEKMTEEQRNNVNLIPVLFYYFYSTSPDYAGWNDQEQKHLTAAQRRYNRIAEWGVNQSVNIFQPDFIAIPCLDNEHWFLSIVCHARLMAPMNYNGEQVPEQQAIRDKKEPKAGDSIKQACILVFDSAKDKTCKRKKAMDHIRNFLETMYVDNGHLHDEFAFDKTSVKVASVKCPQQTNVFDCGLFLLEFFERLFLSNPIKDFRMPPLDMTEWFDPEVIVDKREKIALVVLKKMLDIKGSLLEMPPVVFRKPANVLIPEPDKNNNADVQNQETQNIPPLSFNKQLGEVQKPVISKTDELQFLLGDDDMYDEEAEAVSSSSLEEGESSLQKYCDLKDVIMIDSD